MDNASTGNASTGGTHRDELYRVLRFAAWLTGLLLVCVLMVIGLASLGRLVAPASVPPQLAAFGQPGDDFRLSADTVQAGPLRLTYPDGWRVIKLSEAGQPLRFAVATADDAVVVTVSLQRIDDSSAVTIAGTTFYTRVDGNRATVAASRSTIDAMLDSITIVTDVSG